MLILLIKQKPNPNWAVQLSYDEPAPWLHKAESHEFCNLICSNLQQHEEKSSQMKMSWGSGLLLALGTNETALLHLKVLLGKPATTYLLLLKLWYSVVISTAEDQSMWKWPHEPTGQIMYLKWLYWWLFVLFYMNRYLCCLYNIFYFYSI